MNNKHKNTRSHRNNNSSATNSQVEFWMRHRRDTMACIEGRLKPEIFKGRYGYLPRIVQRKLDRNARRRVRR